MFLVLEHLALMEVDLRVLVTRCPTGFFAADTIFLPLSLSYPYVTGRRTSLADICAFLVFEFTALGTRF